VSPDALLHLGAQIERPGPIMPVQSIEQRAAIVGLELCLKLWYHGNVVGFPP